MAFVPNKYQQAIYDFIKNGEGNAVVNAVAGSGKCLGGDENVIMYDGTVKNVRDVNVGDLLMGDDSTPRKVLSTTKGYGNLKRIVPQKGKPFICNDVHVLTVDYYNHGTHEILDLSIPTIKETNKYNHIHPNGNFRNIKLVRAKIEFQKKNLFLDPWLYGVWIGDGTRMQTNITNPDTEIINQIERVLPEGYYPGVRKYGNDGCEIISILCESHARGSNKIRQFLRTSSDNEGKFIISDYLLTSRSDRLKLLAGIIDTDGYHDGHGCFQISTKWERLGNQIVFLARSLGFAAYMSQTFKRASKTKPYDKYYQITISGETDEIPTVVERKKAPKRKSVKNVLHVGFRIDDIGEGEYYGFTLSGNGRFLLDDFTITHNTSTMVNVLNIIDSSKPVLFLAFNKSIVDELKVKIGEKPNVQIKTLHSLGSSLCYKAFHSSINADKYTKYINKNIKENKYKPSKRLDKDELLIWCNNIRALCDYGRLELALSKEAMKSVAEKHDLLIIDNEIDFALKAIKWGETNVAEIDFTDMIYFPNVKKMDIPTFDFVFIDECQDLNAAQREFFLKCVDPDDGRFVGVGDKNQSIYSFAGADAESFDKLTKVPNTRMLPLSVCYRCDKSIIKKAQKIVPQIEWRDDAPEGIVDTEATIEDVQDGDMIICRVSAPLVKLCIHFIKNGIKAYIKGYDIGKGLVSSLKQTKEENVKDALRKINDGLAELINKVCKLSGYSPDEAVNTSIYQSQKDKVECIEALCEGYDKVEDVIKRISDIFDDNEKTGICLSTIHKAKGLENDRVFILNEDKMYPKWAMKNKIQTEQERNLEYVAITRPKKYLGYIAYDTESDFIGRTGNSAGKDSSSNR